MRVRSLALAASALVLAGCAGVGGPKPGAPAHHRERGFANIHPVPAPPGGFARLSFFVSRVWSTTFFPKSADLPVVPNDGRALRVGGARPTVTWVGHSTLLVQLGGVNLLTDPQWSSRASPVSFMGPRRVTPPGLTFEALPAIDAVLISHDHYDHLDLATIRRLHQAHRPQFFVPLGLRTWFADIGIEDVVELDWWEARPFRGLTLTCVPAQHFAARTLWDRNRRLWAGWTVAGAGRRLYFAGDTGYYPGLREIGLRLGPFDLAAIPIGAYVPGRIMHTMHTTPEEALAVLADVRGERILPIHWGTFDLADEPLAEPPQRLAAEASRLGLAPARVWLLRHGETRDW